MNMSTNAGLRLSRRVAQLSPLTAPPGAAMVMVPDHLLDAVHAAALAGETHYTSRPGIPALRREIASRLAAIGMAADADTEVVITAGIREGLFATLLALKAKTGTLCLLGPSRHEPLFQLLGWTVTTLAAGPISAAAVYRESSDPAAHERAVQALIDAPAAIDILDLRDRIGRNEAAADDGAAPPVLPDRTIVVGRCGLPGQAAFGTGFVAAPARLMGAIRTWKQAFSICTAAPSQRAALVGFAGGRS